MFTGITQNSATISNVIIEYHTLLMSRIPANSFYFVSSQVSSPRSVAYPGFFFGGGGSTNSVEDRGEREWGSGGGSPLVRCSGGSCNLVQEISFHMVKFS